jgi:hypothetical protein
MADYTREEILAKVAAGESLEGADLSFANLNQAELSGANLNRANLSEADLSGASLYGADLSGAKLFHTNLSGADLFKADLREAKYGVETKWPGGFDPVAAGALLVDWPDGVRGYVEPDR